jgi:AbiV family abortive infection protein
MARLKWKKLDYEEIGKGIEHCHWNVYRLMKGASLSFSTGLYGNAVMQAILAMEEQGRKLLLWTAYIDGIELDEEWWETMFRDHKGKIASLAMGHFFAKGQRKWMKTIHRIGSQYQKLKEHAMYVTFDIQKDRWVHPGTITKGKALVVLKEAKSFAKTTDDMMVEED